MGPTCNRMCTGGQNFEVVMVWKTYICSPGIHAVRAYELNWHRCSQDVVDDVGGEQTQKDDGK